MTTHTDTQTVATWSDRVQVNVRVAGDGPPVAYLHGPTGLIWDEFLDALAAKHRVYAPELPGTSPGHPDAIKAIDDLWDLVLHYYEVFDQLGLKSPPVIGHSFGGMLAAELAATNPSSVGKLILIAPLGLWTSEEPIAHYQMMTREELAHAMVGDGNGPVVSQLLSLPQDERENQDARIHWMWSMGCASKFTWPIPDRGLNKRLHRIAAPTLILWGEQDRIAAPSYAERWANEVADSRVQMIGGAGHVPQLERLTETVEQVESFLQD